MIAFLTGKVAAIEPAFVMIEAHGIGYQVHISLQTFSEIKEHKQVTIFTHFLVRDDAHVLYGFSQQAEKNMFQYLIGVNGVGPGSAMAILSCLSTAELQAAIVAENVDTLQAVKGIGSKSARRIVLELKDKLKKAPVTDEKTGIVAEKHNTIKREALTALMTLGLSKGAAEKSIDAVLDRSTAPISLEELIKRALKRA